MSKIIVKKINFSLLKTLYPWCLFWPAPVLPSVRVISWVSSQYLSSPDCLIPFKHPNPPDGRLAFSSPCRTWKCLHILAFPRKMEMGVESSEGVNGMKRFQRGSLHLLFKNWPLVFVTKVLLEIKHENTRCRNALNVARSRIELRQKAFSSLSCSRSVNFSAHARGLMNWRCFVIHVLFKKINNNK